MESLVGGVICSKYCRRQRTKRDKLNYNMPFAFNSPPRWHDQRIPGLKPSETEARMQRAITAVQSKKQLLLNPHYTRLQASLCASLPINAPTLSCALSKGSTVGEVVYDSTEGAIYY